jgi:signal transduction histidine kinase
MGKLIIFKGLQRRWLINSLAAIILLVLIVIAAFAVVTADHYYNNIETSLRARAATIARFLSDSNTASYDDFYQNVLFYTSTFSYRDSVELQYINHFGRIELSSSGLTAGLIPQTADVRQCLSFAQLSVYRGVDPLTDERVISVTAPVYYNGTQLVGVLRLVSSLRLADRRITQYILFAAGIGLLLTAVLVFTNMLFIASITRPLREVTETAKRIAGGGYGIRIEKEYNDEIGELADTLNDMSAEIRTAEQIKTDFISSVSHELRTPLTAITGWGETLLSGDIGDPNDVREGIRIMLKETNRLSHMVEQTLDFTRRESGRLVMNMEPFSFYPDFMELFRFYQDGYRADGIKLNYYFREGIPVLTGDRERLKQVIINLLDNAAKHGNYGKRIDAGIYHENNEIIISIKDYGAGISAEDLPHVKMKYYRGSGAVRGNGIGLSISDEIIRAHNGQLEINSIPGDGTEVTIRLPLA